MENWSQPSPADRLTAPVLRVVDTIMNAVTVTGRTVWTVRPGIAPNVAYLSAPGHGVVLVFVTVDGLLGVSAPRLVGAVGADAIHRRLVAMLGLSAGELASFVAACEIPARL